MQKIVNNINCDNPNSNINELILSIRLLPNQYSSNDVVNIMINLVHFIINSEYFIHRTPVNSERIHNNIEKLNNIITQLNV